MNNKLRLIIALAVTTTVGGAILAGCGRGKPPTEAQTEVATGTPVLVETATRGVLSDQLVLTGTAQPDQDSILNAEVPGNVVAVYVRVGDRVRAGQTVVRMDTDLASAQLAQSAALVRSAQARQSQAQVSVQLTEESTRVGVRQAEIGVQAAQDQLRKAQAAYELTRAQVENGVAQAQTGLDAAQATLRDVQAGARAQEIAQAQAALDQAQAALRLAQSDHNRVQNLYQAGAISQQQVDTSRTNLEVAQGRVQQAQEALSLARAGARTEQVRLAELGVTQARQALQLAESRRDQITVAQRDVNAAEAALSNAQQGLNLARSQRQQVALQQEEARAAAAAVGQARAGQRYAATGLAKLYVRAPFSGQVAERMVQPGSSAGTGTELLRLVSLQPMKVRAQVSELQVTSLRVGQSAEVTVDGLPGRKFPGRIARISPAAVAGERTYHVDLEVTNTQELIKAGMFCRATIVLDTVPDAVIVSRDALVENAERRLVYAVVDGKIAVREVQIGAQSNNHVQIVAGVQPGDQLAVSGQSLLAEGQKVRPQERNSAEVRTESEAMRARPEPATPSGSPSAAPAP